MERINLHWGGLDHSQLNWAPHFVSNTAQTQTPKRNDERNSKRDQSMMGSGQLGWCQDIGERSRSKERLFQPYIPAHPAFQKPLEFFSIPPGCAEVKPCLWIFCFAEATLLHADSAVIIPQQQRAEPSISLSLTDRTHLINREVKRKYAKRFCLSSTFKFQKKKTMNKQCDMTPDLSD